MILEPDESRIRLRPHGGRYEEEMAQAVYIDEAKDVLAYIHCFLPDKNPAMHELAQRYFGIDQRNLWHSWLITLRGHPILWTDKEVPGISKLPSVKLAGSLPSFDSRSGKEVCANEPASKLSVTQPLT